MLQGVVLDVPAVRSPGRRYPILLSKTVKNITSRTFLYELKHVCILIFVSFKELEFTEKTKPNKLKNLLCNTNDGCKLGIYSQMVTQK